MKLCSLKIYLGSYVLLYIIIFKHLDKIDVCTVNKMKTRRERMNDGMAYHYYPSQKKKDHKYTYRTRSKLNGLVYYGVSSYYG